MRFSLDFTGGAVRLPAPVRLGCVFLAWLLLITWLHYRLNQWSPDRQIVRMGYMPVVTNLAAPLLDHISRHGTDVHFEAVKFASFAEMAEALRNDNIQAAFIIAPLAVVLRQQGADVKVVLIGNRRGEIVGTRVASAVVIGPALGKGLAPCSADSLGSSPGLPFCSSWWGAQIGRPSERTRRSRRSFRQTSTCPLYQKQRGPGSTRFREVGSARGQPIPPCPKAHA